MTPFSITRSKQETALILIGNGWREGGAMSVELELPLISKKFFLTNYSIHPCS